MSAFRRDEASSAGRAFVGEFGDLVHAIGFLYVILATDGDNSLRSVCAPTPTSPDATMPT